MLSLASNLGRSETRGVVLVRIMVTRSIPVDVLGTDALVVHRHDVPVIPAGIALLVLVGVLKSL